MPRTSPRARTRAALDHQLDHQHSRRRVRERAVAVLAVGVLGAGVAGSIVLTGNAQLRLAATAPTPASAAPQVEVTRVPGVKLPRAFDQHADRSGRVHRADRSMTRPGGTAPSVQQEVRDGELEARAASIDRTSEDLIERRDRERAEAAKRKAAEEKREREERGEPTLPVTSRYTIAARFGDVGAWSRYHTGFDFSAPIGTKVHAPTAGTVTTAGSGKASGWAGTYVTVRHDDGTQTLYAHLSSVTVKVGDHVRGGDVIGHIGMTGRAFGPHLHFEVYPKGIEPGDIYSAVDPKPWLADLGLRP